MQSRSHRVPMSSLTMTLLVAVSVSVTGAFSLAIYSIEAAQFMIGQSREDLKQAEGVIDKEPEPCTRLD